MGRLIRAIPENEKVTYMESPERYSQCIELQPPRNIKLSFFYVTVESVLLRL